MNSRKKKSKAARKGQIRRKEIINGYIVEVIFKLGLWFKVAEGPVFQDAVILIVFRGLEMQGLIKRLDNKTI